ncbi:hypothetical protein BDZ89DRAFT_1045320 [Hymenopellis radicata]|nr:hypothetical protein BDZ89DRAFT_1045320 [Hymenopellis radicata]
MLFVSRRFASLDSKHSCCRRLQRTPSQPSDGTSDTHTLLPVLRDAFFGHPQKVFLIETLQRAMDAVETRECIITHLKITYRSSAVKLAALSSKLPNLITLELRKVRVKQRETVNFHAPNLEHMTFWQCQVDGIALSTLIMGSPKLNTLCVVGTKDFAGWDVWIPGTPRPQIGSIAKALTISLVGRCETFHILSWAYATTFIPLRMLSVRLNVSFIHAFHLILEKCQYTLDTLYIFIQGLLRLRFRLLRNIETLRLMVHASLLKEIAANMRGILMHQRVHTIDLFVILTSLDASLDPIADIDAMYRDGGFPHLQRFRLVLVLQGDADYRSAQNVYESVTDNLCMSMKKDGKHHFGVTIFPNVFFHAIRDQQCVRTLALSGATWSDTNLANGLLAVVALINKYYHCTYIPTLWVYPISTGVFDLKCNLVYGMMMFVEA